jgi:NAD-dependent deacetylase
MTAHPTDIFILTGAGISAESGLGTFRDTDGVWARFDPAKLATPEGFAADPEAVLAFYDARRRGLLEARPNAAHEALARLEAGLAARGGRLTLVTQNIDDLHERAGHREVLHMHGELLKARCTSCEAVVEARADLSTAQACAACGRMGGMRPHVVWFGEIPFHLDAIEERLMAADLFVAIGTSGAVYPAAGLVGAARQAGIATREINLEPSDNAHLFDEADYGRASEAVPRWVEEVLGG